MNKELVKRLLKDKVAVVCTLIIAVIIILGIFAPVFAPNDPYATDILVRYSSPSFKYPLGTDNLGRCVLSRLIYGIRPTIFLSLLTMVCTILIGTLLGIIAGYFGGIIDEVIMRICDIMLSFPSQVMILAVVGVLGTGMQNVVLANILIKWAWYARMIRGFVLKYNNKNYMIYSKAVGSSNLFILRKHLLPSILSELIVLITLDMGWVILNISTLSFLGLGVQAPTAEWGAMLGEAKNVMASNPQQMIAPGCAILIVVAAFNFLGDSLRDILDPKSE